MKRHAFLIILILLCTLLAAETTLAMGSLGYSLDWFTPLTTSSGRTVTSTNYIISFSLGQTAIQSASSTNFGINLGFWVELGEWFYRTFLPVLQR